MTDKLEQMVAATAGIQRGLPRVEIQEMTENEKAATFIGWREGHRCTAHGDSRYPEVCKHGFVWSYGNHDIPAPDMTDPRNYMKALEGLRIDKIKVELFTIVTGHGDQWRCNLAWNNSHSRLHDNAATAVVTALSALWNEQHT